MDIIEISEDDHRKTFEKGLRYKVFGLTCTEWKIGDVLDRADGPAVITADGWNDWYSMGLLHREGGPAGYNGKGIEYWYKHGELHRADGPAFIEKEFGKEIEKEWYYNGVRYSLKEFFKILSKDERKKFLLNFANF